MVQTQEMIPSKTQGIQHAVIYLALGLVKLASNVINPNLITPTIAFSHLSALFLLPSTVAAVCSRENLVPWAARTVEKHLLLDSLHANMMRSVKVLLCMALGRGTKVRS
jgi:hypothetical protein